MRFSTYLLGFSLLTGVTACSSTGGTPSGVSAGGNAGSGGSPNGGAGNATSSGGSAGSHAGSSSSLGGMASTAGGSGGATAAGGGGSPAMGGSSGGSSIQSSGAQVLTWVPPYHVNEAKQMLAANFGNLTAADGISRVALQFWATNGGSLSLSNEGDIAWFHDWARQHGVQILLCVDNFVGTDWNWPEAERSFKDNGPAFAASILSEISKRDLDGVDLDLEGQDSPGVPV
ncbi:MAG TPA: hypothetical protein VNW92_24575, partial [Polyangiaceae bacterium]|nr:hypothetical protein [Polyangiaceae bacterium]